MDAVMAVTVVVIAMIGFFVFTSGTLNSQGNDALIEENTILATAMGSPSAGGNLSLSSAQIDEVRILALSKKNYTQIKQELGLVTDFCIYFTDKDNSLVDIGGVRFLGAPNINVTVGDLHYSCDGTLRTFTQCNNDKNDDEDLEGLVDMQDPSCQAPSDDTE